MALTPDDVRNKQFTTVRLREGYDEDEVDAFLDEVEAELARLLRENDELRQRLMSAQQSQIAPQNELTQTAPVPVTAELPQMQAAPVQEQQVQAVPQPVAAAPFVPAAVAAPAYLEPVAQAPVQQAPVQQAPFQQAPFQQAPFQQAPFQQAPYQQAPPAPSADAAARVLELAQRTADDLVAQATSDADRIVGEARLRAETTERESQVQRAALEARVEDLRNFEREYRTRMRGYFENQLRELESRSGVDPSSALGAAAPTALEASAPAAIPAAQPVLAAQAPAQAAPAQPVAPQTPVATPVPVPVPAAVPVQPAPAQVAPVQAPPMQAPPMQPPPLQGPPMQAPTAPAQPIVTPSTPFPPSGAVRPAGPFSPPAATPVPTPESE